MSRTLLDDVLLLGDPGLRRVSTPVGTDRGDPELVAATRRLQATLAAFREAHGFGRAMAAPQIGVHRRLIALSLGPGSPELMIDPVITWRSDETFSLWDDCMSFPSLLVMVRRHASISVGFVDQTGEERTWERLDRAVSELLQHEIDHLDGILAVDRAVDGNSLVLREVFERAPERFRALVDGV